MATIIAISALLLVVAGAFSIFLKPNWTFYLFLTSCLFGNIFGGYVQAAGNLGLPRAWQPSDALVLLTILAAFREPKSVFAAGGVIKKCFLITAVLGLVALIQGLLFHTHAAITDSRALHFIAAMIFAGRYLTDKQRVDKFLRFTGFLVTIMFVLHMLIRFGIFTPPISKEEAISQLGGERGELALVMVVYLALLSMAICRISTKRGSSFISILMLLVALAGIALSETRTLLGSVAFMAFAVAVFIKGRIKITVLYGAAALLIIWMAGKVGFNPLSRFRGEYGESTITNLKETAPWRMMEFTIIVESYVSQPYLILTGRGIGAPHEMPFAKTGIASYYHSEFLGWLDKFGLTGLLSFICIFIVCMWHSFRLARSNIPNLRFYGNTVFLLLCGLLPHNIFSPSFMNPRAAPLLIGFVAIIANWRAIYYNSYADQYEASLVWDDGNEQLSYYPEFA